VVRHHNGIADSGWLPSLGVMAFLLSVNIGSRQASAHTDVGVTGIDKRPVAGPVEVRAPGRKGVGGSGLIGDAVCDLRHHGGDDQAVYAFAREDLDYWQEELGRPLPGGVFGENLTTSGLEVSDALVGEQWQVGDTVLLEVCSPRVPCRTFAGWLGERGWVRTFTQQARSGAYLRVLRPGMIEAGDEVLITHKPDRGVTASTVFRAVTTAPDLLPQLVDIEALPAEIRDMARKRTTYVLPDA